MSFEAILGHIQFDSSTKYLPVFPFRLGVLIRFIFHSG